MPDRDVQTRVAFGPVLASGEVLRLHGGTNVAHGDTGPATEWENVDSLADSGNRFWSFATRTWPRKILFFTVLSPLLLIGLLESIGDGISSGLDRLVGGVTLSGSRGSAARRMQHALSPLGARGNRMAVTDRRLVVFREHHSLRGGPPRVELTWSLPLAEIAAARPYPRGLLRRRLQVSFRDGSMIVLACPLSDAPKPASFAAALVQLPGRPF